MNEKINFVLIESKRGSIVARLSFPDGLVQIACIEKLDDLWLISENEISPKASAWLRSSNKLFLTPYEVRKLRKNGIISIAANSEHLKLWWKEVHQAKNGMYQRFNTPNLSNI